MNALKIRIIGSDEVANLRHQVAFALAIDSPSPTVAYICAHCGTIIGFSGAFDLVTSHDVDCPQCGTFNTLEAA